MGLPKHSDRGEEASLPRHSWIDPSLLWLAIAFLLCILCFLIFRPWLFLLPTWSEEKGWLSIAQDVVSGAEWNPFQRKSDFPSRFQAWPIAAVHSLGVSVLESSRIVAFLYAAIASLYLQRLTLLFHPKAFISATLLQASYLFSHTLLVPIVLGWHEISVVPPLMLGSVYHVLAFQRGRQKSQLLLAGLVLGISMWTLYTPALFGACLILPLVFGAMKVERRRVALLFLATTVISTPVIVQVYFSGGGDLARHYRFFVEGGEWENTKYGEQKPFLDALKGNVTQVGSYFLPRIRSAHSADEAVEPSLEIPLALLASIGLAISFFDSRLRWLLVGPASLFVVGLILSNPTVWRTSALGPLQVMFAAAAVARFQAYKWLRLALVLICTAQFFAFQRLFEPTLDHIATQLRPASSAPEQ